VNVDEQRLEFSSPAWREHFAQSGWADFEVLWNLQADTVEPPNVRRGGWSSVARIESPAGAAFYLKRQENHDFRDWGSGLKRTPTVVREWEVGVTFRTFGIRTAEPVCCGVDQRAGSRGVLVTVALDDYRSLPEVLQDPTLASADRRNLWETLADDVLRLHQQGYRHNCLYGQHILLKQLPDGSWDVGLIDLEKASRTRRKNRATIADLSALDRHTDDMSQRDRQWFWDRYFKDVPLSTRRSVLLPLARRTAVRTVRHYLRDCASGRRG